MSEIQKQADEIMERWNAGAGISHEEEVILGKSILIEFKNLVDMINRLENENIKLKEKIKELDR